eukprot:94157-Chlamydomonas_euryale.AAC.2
MSQSSRPRGVAALGTAGGNSASADHGPRGTRILTCDPPRMSSSSSHRMLADHPKVLAQIPCHSLWNPIPCGPPPLSGLCTSYATHGKHAM